MAELNEQGTRPSPYCGRVDLHDEHDHHTNELLIWQRTPLTCPGNQTLEGGAPR